MNSQNITTFKKWMIAIRPFALPASTSPVIFGTVLAVFIGGVDFNVFYFILALLGMMILHSGANILSDITDFNRKIDTQPNPVSGAIVRGLITTKEAWKAAVLLIVLGSAIGIYLVIQVGISLLIIGSLGVAIGVLYTRGGVFSLKYHALGDAAVFLNFGILGTLGAWIVQTGQFDYAPVIFAVPVSLLVIAIVHANNWRDIETDSKIGIKTLAIYLKDQGSLMYFGFLIFFPFVYMIALVVLKYLDVISLPAPLSLLIVLLAFPKALSLFKQALRRKTPKHPMEFVALDGATAQLNLLFGLLCSAAIVLNGIL